MKTNVSWVDLLVAIVLLWGMARGRKRGMSEELLDLIKWGLIVVIAGICYEPSGRVFASLTAFSLLSSYLFTYTLIALGIFVTFGVIRKRLGEKLVGSDAFGRGEYYLGMVAGTFRYLCIVLVTLAFLHARHYSQADIDASAKYQNDNFGSQFFVTVPDLQREVFTQSGFGRLTRDYLHVVLIKSTSPADKGLNAKGTVAHARETAINEILDRK